MDFGPAIDDAVRSLNKTLVENTFNSCPTSASKMRSGREVRQRLAALEFIELRWGWHDFFLPNLPILPNLSKKISGFALTRYNRSQLYLNTVVICCIVLRRTRESFGTRSRLGWAHRCVAAEKGSKVLPARPFPRSMEVRQTMAVGANKITRRSALGETKGVGVRIALTQYNAALTKAEQLKTSLSDVLRDAVHTGLTVQTRLAEMVVAIDRLRMSATVMPAFAAVAEQAQDVYAECLWGALDAPPNDDSFEARMRRVLVARQRVERRAEALVSAYLACGLQPPAEGVAEADVERLVELVASVPADGLWEDGALRASDVEVVTHADEA